jgi:hypothetical protein
MPQGAFWNNWKNQAIPASGSTVSSTRTSGAYLGYQGGDTGNDVAIDPYVADVLSMSDKDRLAVSQMLKAAGYLEFTTSKYNKSLGDAYARAANDWAVDAARTGRTGLTLKAFLQENVIPTQGKERIPSRSIYQYAPEQLAAKIDETAQSLLGRAITDADKAASWYQDLNKALNKMVMQGTVTEPTKKVKNPKTGKMENVSIQRPEVTSESIAQKITGALTAADPVALERKKNLDFANWAFEKMGGGR